MKPTKDKIKTLCKEFMKWFDPYQQSFLYLPWNFWTILIVIGADIWCTRHVHYDIYSASGLIMTVISWFGGVIEPLVFSMCDLIMIVLTLLCKIVIISADSIEAIKPTLKPICLFLGHLSSFIIFALMYKRALRKNGRQILGIPVLVIVGCWFWALGDQWHKIFISIGIFFLLMAIWSLVDLFWNSEKQLKKRNEKPHL
ncbi:MAG: hypothetical protein J5601_01295 [Elusimicrobiaceae bacterium]|nr:hypothetical protein [Elusimicrobiaceae bacterium]